VKTREGILALVRETLVSEFGCPAEKVVESSRFFEDLDLDSIDAVDLIVRLKNEYSLQVTAEDFKSIRTIGDLLDVLVRLLAAQGK